MSYTSLRYHIVTTTKGRRPLITRELERTLFRALRHQVEELGGKVFIINGVEDHVHLVIAIPATIAIAEFVGKVKAYASRIVRRRCPDFGWQDGYAAFTVSTTEMEELIDYVFHQKTHHANGTTNRQCEVPPEQ